MSALARACGLQEPFTPLAACSTSAARTRLPILYKMLSQQHPSPVRSASCVCRVQAARESCLYSCARSTQVCSVQLHLLAGTADAVQKNTCSQHGVNSVNMHGPIFTKSICVVFSRKACVCLLLTQSNSENIRGAGRGPGTRTTWAVGVAWAIGRGAGVAWGAVGRARCVCCVERGVRSGEWHGWRNCAHSQINGGEPL